MMRNECLLMSEERRIELLPESNHTIADSSLTIYSFRVQDRIHCLPMDGILGSARGQELNL